MEKFQEIKGDLIKLAKEGKFNVITHGCNCQCTMGAGIAPLIAKAFGADDFDMETYVSYEKLGNIDYETVVLGENAIWNLNDADNKLKEPELIVVNSYTQFNYGRNHADGDKIPLDYDALTLCLRKINHQFKGLHIGLPLIGCGLAGGLWSLDSVDIREQHIYVDANFKFVKDIIKQELKDMFVTIVHFDDKYLK